MLTVKRYVSMIGALAVLALLAACSDAVVDSNDQGTVTTDDPYEVLKLDYDEVDGAAMDEVDVAASEMEDLLLNRVDRKDDRPNDRGRQDDKRPSDGRDRADDHRRPHDRGPKDHLHHVSYSRIIRALELTDEQTESVKLCFEDLRECVSSANTRYVAAVKEQTEELRNAVERLRTAVDNGDMTPEEAREVLKGLVDDYRASVKELTEAYREAVKACHEAFEACVESILTPEQLEIWNEWKASREDHGGRGGDDDGGDDDGSDDSDEG